MNNKLSVLDWEMYEVKRQARVPRTVCRHVAPRKVVAHGNGRKTWVASMARECFHVGNQMTP